MHTLKDRLNSPEIDLTKSERKVLRALLDDYPRLGLGPMARLARQAGVSDPTIQRLVRKLGFQGYSDFQSALMTEVDDRLRSPRTLLAGSRERMNTDSDLWEKMLIDACDRIHQTHALTQLDDIRLLGDWLLDPRMRVFCHGGRFSRFLAGYLTTHLRVLRSGCTLLDDGLSLPDQLNDVDRQSLVIVFDYRRYQAQALGVASTAKARGARVVLFTDVYASPLREFADLIISAAVESPSPFDTLVPATAQIEALIATLVARMDGQLDERFEGIDQLRAAFGSHILED
jgi:DNA-binding MurR/RpiR family transcriptional regulator